MRKIRITNAEGRDAVVAYETVRGPKPPALGLPGRSVTFRRYLSSAPSGTHEALSEAHGEDYGQALIDGDPEVDMETVGRTLGPTDNVFLSHDGEVLYAPPEQIDVVTGPDGQERSRSAASSTPSNVQGEHPLRWTSRRMPVDALARGFAVRRSLQLHHVDGLTFDFLFAMAKSLHEAGEAVLVGAGEKGKDPLIFQENGSPYRGFLEGRIDGDRYQLLLHLSSLQLKVPEASS
jgi:hypothetical protein